MISHTLAIRSKKVLPAAISSDQTTFIKNRFIGENGRLISDILEASNALNIDGLLGTVNVEKAFSSVNHSFLISVLESLGFGDSNLIN